MFLMGMKDFDFVRTCSNLPKFNQFSNNTFLGDMVVSPAPTS